jgi:hypothetical protein
MSAGQATPDVIPVSKRLYDMAFGFAAARVAVEFCMRYSKRICDPFCGHGTVLHVAEEMGADSVGVDIDPKVCKIARRFAQAGPLFRNMPNKKSEEGSRRLRR